MHLSPGAQTICQSIRDGEPARRRARGHEPAGTSLQVLGSIAATYITVEKLRHRAAVSAPREILRQGVAKSVYKSPSWCEGDLPTMPTSGRGRCPHQMDSEVSRDTATALPRQKGVPNPARNRTTHSANRRLPVRCPARICRMPSNEPTPPIRRDEIQRICTRAAVNYAAHPAKLRARAENMHAGTAYSNAAIKYRRNEIDSRRDSTP